MNIDALPWFHVTKPLKNPKLRLFCFSYAGGSAGVFYDWQSLLPEGVEVFSVQLPGRSDRIAERPLTKLGEIVDGLYKAIQPYIKSCEYCFFGHSMGARVSYELASLLESNGFSAPRGLFVSGALAPNQARKKPNIHHLPKPDFIRELGQINGTPKELLENTQLMEFILPVLKADFHVCETWPMSLPKKMNVPITALCGDSDDDISPDDMKHWSAFTGVSFKLFIFFGDHFFIHSRKTELVSALGGLMEKHLECKESCCF
ncbi:MAG: alpha/beta fold hydrolase [Agarilytica sp.]